MNCILLVEDEDDLRFLNCEFLSRRGYKVLAAGNGEDAIEIWNKNKDSIELLLTDFRLPGAWNGRQLAEKFRSEKPQLKVLLTSGSSCGVNALESDGREAFPLLAKPFLMGELAESVERCLKPVEFKED